METYTNTENRTTNIFPVIPLRGKVAFPHTTIIFEVGRDMTVKAINRASAGDKLVLILTQRDTEKTDISPEDIYVVGCVARIKQVAQLQGGAMRVSCEGLYRACARSVTFAGGHFSAVCDPINAITSDETLQEAYFRTAKALAEEIFADNKTAKDLVSKISIMENADEFVDVTTSAMRVKLDVKQEILEEAKTIERLRLLEHCLNEEMEIGKLEKKIAASVRQSIDKNQKEYFLREQLKAIHAELGDDEHEADEYRAQILEKGLPQDLEIKCLKEIDRLSKMPSSAAEYTVIASYLEQVISLPWTEETKDTELLTDCIKVLDADHYGLEKIKERITEYLAQRESSFGG